MDKNKKELTQNEIAAMVEAAKEKNFTPGSLLQEITPLLDEYFLGRFQTDGCGISCKFLNGQSFRITAEEV